MNSFNTPVAFFIFKRPVETGCVFETIRKIKPSTLLIVSDGPRNEEEKILCEESRKVVEKIDWPCRVLKNYSETNLGCKIRVSSGLDWVFQNVEKAIILEDDCLPDESFFKYCQDLLNKYQDNDQVMHIGGLNINQDQKNMKESYYFSHIAQIWGWATWRRAWQKYDVNMADWPEVKKENRLQRVLNNPPAVDYFEYLYQKMYEGRFDTWDIAWAYAVMKENAFAIVPKANLVENIGFGKGATHVGSVKGNFGNIKAQTTKFPLVHPDKTEVNIEADKYVYKKVFGIQTRIGQKILWFAKYNFPKTYELFKSSYNYLLRKT